MTTTVTETIMPCAGASDRILELVGVDVDTYSPREADLVHTAGLFGEWYPCTVTRYGDESLVVASDLGHPGTEATLILRGADHTTDREACIALAAAMDKLL